jgi:hypothetical protein
MGALALLRDLLGAAGEQEELCQEDANSVMLCER